MDKIILLGFGLGTSVVAMALFLYLRRVRREMRRFVLRFEKISDKVD